MSLYVRIIPVFSRLLQIACVLISDFYYFIQNLVQYRPIGLLQPTAIFVNEQHLRLADLSHVRGKCRLFKTRLRKMQCWGLSYIAVEFSVRFTIKGKGNATETDAVNWTQTFQSGFFDRNQPNGASVLDNDDAMQASSLRDVGQKRQQSAVSSSTRKKVVTSATSMRWDARSQEIVVDWAMQPMVDYEILIFLAYVICVDWTVSKKSRVFLDFPLYE